MTSTFNSVDLNNGIPVTLAVGNVHTDFGFYNAFFVFELEARMRDGQTDRQTDGRTYKQYQ